MNAWHYGLIRRTHNLFSAHIFLRCKQCIDTDCNIFVYQNYYHNFVHAYVCHSVGVVFEQSNRT